MAYYRFKPLLRIAAAGLSCLLLVTQHPVSLQAAIHTVNEDGLELRADAGTAQPAAKTKKTTAGKRNSQNKRQRHHKAKKRNTSKQKSGMSWIQLHQQFPETFMLNGSRDQMKVALTFDDVPDPRFTPAILDVLARYRICATFFVVGERAAKHPELVARMMREGHVIGNHSYNHAVFSKLTLDQFQWQLGKTNEILYRITGKKPTLLRPPYGELLTSQVKWSNERGYTVVNWDVDSEDWRNNPDSSLVIANIRKTLQPGSIILQHAGGGEGQDLSGTINALPPLIEWLQGKGYSLVTLPELLNRKPYR
ncbi:polysaccharide deacetylase family protein [Paenibacillus sp. CAU 1782]